MPPAALADGELAYARGGNSADTVAVELGDMAESYCKSRKQVVTVDGRDDVPGVRQIEVTLKFHCHPAGQPPQATPAEQDEGETPLGVGPWAR